MLDKIRNRLLESAERDLRLLDIRLSDCRLPGECLTRFKIDELEIVDLTYVCGCRCVDMPITKVPWFRVELSILFIQFLCV